MARSFVFIFRQGSRKLAEDEQKQRTEEVREFALKQVKDGRGLDPRILGEESLRLGDGSIAINERSVIAFNFIEATDFSDAVKIAESHPGLRYGVNIEVRPWIDPRASKTQ